MRRFLKFLGIGLGSVIGILVLAVLAVLFIPDNSYRGWLTEAAQSATGRALSIDEFSLDFGSHLILDAGGVTLANAEWGSEPALFSAERLRADVALRPLLKGIVQVSVSAEGPKLALETDASGRGNWELGSGEPRVDSKSTGAGSDDVALDIVPKIQISDGRIDYLDGVGGKRERFDLKRFDLGDGDGRLTVELDGAFRDQSITVSGDLGELRSILTGQSTDSVAEAHLGDVTLSSKGRYANLLGAQGPTIDLALAANTASTASLGPFAGRPIPELGRLDVAGRIEGRDGTLAGRELNLKLDGPDTSADVSGQIEDLTSLTGVDLVARLSSDTVPVLAQALGVTLPAEAPESVKANLSLKSRGDSYEISEIDVVVTGAAVNGEIKGQIADLTALRGIELDVRAYVESLAPYSNLAGVELPDTTPLTITAEVTAARGAEEEARISAELASDWLQGQVDARIAELGAFQGVQGSIDLELQSLAMFSEMIGRELPAMGPVVAKAQLASRDQSYALNDIALSIKEGPLQAELSGGVADLLALAGVALEVDARLASLSNFSALAGTELPETKPLRVKAKASSPKGLQGPAEVATTIESEWLNGGVVAALENLSEVAGLTAKIDLKLTALSELSSIAGRELPAMGPLSASAQLASRDETYALTGLDLNMSDEVLQAQVKGSILDILTVQGLDLDVTGRVDSLAGLTALAGAELPETPPLDLEAKLTAKGGLKAPADVRATLQSEGVRADVTGTLANLVGVQGAEMALFLKAATLEDIGKLAGMPFADLSPVDVRAEVIVSEEALDLSSLFAVVGKSDVTGNLKIERASEGGQGAVTGLFESRIFDLAELLASTRQTSAGPSAAEPQSASTEAQTEQSEAGSGTASGASGARVFSDDPLPMDMLNRYNGNVEFKAEQMRLPDITVDRGRVTLDLDGGQLDLVLHRAEVGGRPVEGGLEIDASREPVPMHFKFHAAKVPISGMLANNSMLEGGEVLADVDVHAQGGSVRELMAGLDGHISLAIRDTRLSNVLLRRFGSDILSQINPLTADRGYSGVECAAAALEINDGLATTPRGLITRETEATWIGNGQIDLKTEQISFVLASKPRKGIGLSAGALASALRFGGTLGAPTVEVNPVGVAQKGAEAMLALTTGGMSIFAKGLFDRATSDQGICEQILQTIIEGKSPGEEDTK